MARAQETLPDDLAATIEASRRVERDLFGSMDPVVRARPIREGDWTPQDHQAHLTAWKNRQADRFEAAREGRELPRRISEDETDAINAELQAQRAGWPWDELVREADESAFRLMDGIRATSATVIESDERLLGGTFGNGLLHTLTHMRWLREAGTGIDQVRLRAFADEAEKLARADGFSLGIRSESLYDLACFHVLDGRPGVAKPLLVEAFRGRPDLVDYAPTDPDLTTLADELPELAMMARAEEFAPPAS
jgi:hypothetical protein